jgi:hypothetical protein
MAKRWTRADLETMYNAEQRERSKLEFAIGAAVTESADLETSVDGREQGESYTFRLYQSTRGHGGLFLMIFRYPDQRDSVTVHWLDDAFGDSALAGWADFQRPALYAMRAMRQELLNRLEERYRAPERAA